MLALSLTACSAIKLGYNNLDELLYWWIDDYVDFTGAQSDPVRRALDDLHAWHRRAELPLLADALESLAHGGGQFLAPAQVCGLFDKATDSLARTTERAIPLVADFAVTLDDAQFATMGERFRDKRKDWLADWSLNAEDMAQKRRARFAEAAERFYGTLTPGQNEVIRRHVAGVPFEVARVEHEMRRRERDTLATLRAAAGMPPPQAEAQLRGWLARLLESPDAGYREAMQRTREATCAAWAALHDAATPEQRQRAMARVADYAADLRALAAQR